MRGATDIGAYHARRYLAERRLERLQSAAILIMFMLMCVIW